MLTVHGDTGAQGAKAFWVDLLNPTPPEIAQVAAAYGIEVPSRGSLQEIETSSRLKTAGSALYVSMPLAIQDEQAGFAPLPLGFVLSRELLVTVRYSEIHAFAQVEARVGNKQDVGSTAVFCALIEGMVDFGADKLEQLSGNLATVSARAFGPSAPQQLHDKRASSALRECLKAIGIAGDQLSRSRESTLGLQRIIAFVQKTASDWLSPEEKTRLTTAQQDLVSVVDFEAHLSGKSQFLLDAILGFINTEQNEIFKVLTIVSVVGIPPTLIASMYGMNFHDMPELSWRFGYPYGLALIALSTLLPIIWFKRRGWW
ncbi:MAG TPA: magnesium transporter CorA family protein [Steroidobacteraceae bacterium]|nr:magnesium transporter CorA family protein [Steroidobacteraceae bacterium]